MNLADPNNLPKKPRKARALRGGEPFEAEPGATEASEQWKKAQLARLILRNEQVQGYGNAWPTLDAVQEYNLKDYTRSHEMHWDPEEEKYYTKTYFRYKITYRYYKGQRSKSYLFWPPVVVPGYTLNRQGPSSVDISLETGTATYVKLGVLPTQTDYYGRDQEVWALWKSTGTMKPRRTKENLEVLNVSAI